MIDTTTNAVIAKNCKVFVSQSDSFKKTEQKIAGYFK